MKLLLLISAILLMASCRTTKHISSTRVNTDSLVTHIKDSMSQVHSKETTELRKMIEEMTSSGVTFVIDSCPERDFVRELKDSIKLYQNERLFGWIDNYEMKEKIKSLSNKVTISEKGAITAEGNIKAAYFTNSKLQEELYKSEMTIDELTAERDTINARLTRSELTKVKDVKRSGFPWLILSLVACGACLLGWIARGKITKL